jgi:hypothetical protein
VCLCKPRQSDSVFGAHCDTDGVAQPVSCFTACSKGFVGCLLAYKGISISLQKHQLQIGWLLACLFSMVQKHQLGPRPATQAGATPTLPAATSMLCCVTSHLSDCYMLSAHLKPTRASRGPLLLLLLLLLQLVEARLHVAAPAAACTMPAPGRNLPRVQRVQWVLDCCRVVSVV